VSRNDYRKLRNGDFASTSDRRCGHCFPRGLLYFAVECSTKCQPSRRYHVARQSFKWALPIPPTRCMMFRRSLNITELDTLNIPWTLCNCRATPTGNNFATFEMLPNASVPILNPLILRFAPAARRRQPSGVRCHSLGLVLQSDTGLHRRRIRQSIEVTAPIYHLIRSMMAPRGLAVAKHENIAHRHVREKTCDGGHP
jgi:hypothetical protein